MASRGVLFAIDEATAKKLITLSPNERVDFIYDDIEDDFFDNKPDYLAQTDKAWDAIHRSLTDGFLYWQNGEYPLNHVILGGNILYGLEENENDYIITLKTPKQVKDIAQKLQDFTSEQFKAGYAQIDIENYEYKLGFEDLQYSLYWFEQMQSFWQKAAKENLYVIFTVAL